MKIRHRLYTFVLTVTALGVILAGYSSAYRAGFKSVFPADAPPPPAPAALDSPELKYPIQDHPGDFVTDKPDNPFYLPDPSNIKKDVEYDPTTGKYIVTEKVGGVDIKEPMYLTYQEYLDYTEKQDREDYFKSRGNAITLIEDKGAIPPINMKNPILDRLFGGTKIEVKPQGNLDLTLGGNYQKIDNPNIPIRNRHTGGFDFDMNINMNVVAKIGDKLQLGLKYNTQSGFDFDNQVKLGYTGKEDDIIKEISVGNVGLTLPTRLITGSQSLFGFKTKFQFGRLTMTTIISQQKSKTQSITLDNGALRQNFSVSADQYDENKHFFMAQYFRNHYDYALSNMPTIQSIANVVRLEVWVTNRTGATQNVRNVVGLADLGEVQPYHYPVSPGGSSNPDNSSNGLYSALEYNANGRLINNVQTTMGALNLVQGQDYEVTYARKLQPTEYTFNPQLGYLSLNTALNPNDVLGIAVQYEVNGTIYNVGEFSNLVPPDSGTTSKVIYLKLLKGTAQRVNLPYYKLMMKNIYSLGAYQVSPTDFKLDIYYNDPGGGLKRFLPQGNKGIADVPLIRVMNLDNLDAQGDAQPDGLFDFVPGITIIPANGRIIFPQVEPFGQDLLNAFNSTSPPTPTQISGQYIFQQLYDSTKTVALQFPQYDRFTIKGSYKGSNGSQISLGGINIPKGSVTVTAGGTLLKEGTDYEVDYALGKVTILNQGVLNSGQQVKINFENNSQFGLQQKAVYGERLDYLVSKNFNIGATVMHMTERPFTQVVQIGQDPISNTIFGTDVKYQTNAPWLTKILDALPIYSTKEMSTITAYGEVAHLSPGHQKSINGSDGQGQVYIDDFEGATTNYDLKNPTTNWKLASTPAGAPGPNGRELFPESKLVNDHRYGMNRAKLAWYRIDNSFFTANLAPSIFANNQNALYDPYVRLISMFEIYPTASNQLLDNNIYSFDLQYIPTERGPYNYEMPAGSQYSKGLVPGGSGQLSTPTTRWGGIMRALDNTDLVATNVEFIEFWLLDPFIHNVTSQGGSLYLQLGNVSEDILHDSRLMMENGLNQDTTTMDSTGWGWVPKVLPLTAAFSSTTDQPYEDVGFDGMNDASEYNRLSKTFVNNPSLVSYFASNPAGYQALQKDPSQDDYVWFDDNSYANDPSILHRYKNYNGPDGNSPVQNGTGVSSAATSIPDGEDLNKDFTLNEDEEYFQYRVDLKPGMNVGSNKYIISTQVASVHTDANPNGPVQNQTWYQFRIPIYNYDNKVGDLPDFQYIQFLRMFMTGWNGPDTVVLRLATLDLIRNQWRTYDYPLDPGGPGIPNPDNSNAYFNVGKVDIQDNSSKSPVNYVVPPGIQRTYALGAQTNTYVQQNETSMDITACGLADGSSRAVFKNISLDLRRYRYLRAFVHANAIPGATQVQNNQVEAFVRLGTDFTDNYYQFEVPLHITIPSTTYNTAVTAQQDSVWPPENNINADLQALVTLKLNRDLKNWPRNVPYREKINGAIYTVMGNPDLSQLVTMMLGIKNPARGDSLNPIANDDGQPKCIEVWYDELRVAQFDESGGTAAVGEVAVKLADLGRISLTGNMHTAGFGQIEQKLDQRATDDLYQYTASGNLELGKLLPVKAGIRLPFYASITQSLSNPEYDPYQGDIKVAQELALIRQVNGVDSAAAYKRQIETINIRRGYNFSGVRFMPKLKFKNPQIFDPGNFTFTYSYNQILASDPFIQLSDRRTYIGIVGWSYSPKAKELTPFKKMIKSKSKWLDLIRDFNFNPLPSTLSFNTDVNRDIAFVQLRSLGDGDSVPTTYNKSFKWNRVYAFKWNPFKSFSLDYGANNQAIIDEYAGLVNTTEKKDFVWDNFKQGGRNTNFNQRFSTTYTLPLSKLPALDFITANAGYASTYTWIASPEVVDSTTKLLYGPNPLGNTASNTQSLRGKADLNFKKIYDKVPFLKTYDSPNPSLGDKKENDKKRSAVRKAREKILEEIAKLKEKRDKLKADLTTIGNDKAMPDSVYREKAAKIKQEIKDINKQIRKKRKEYREKQMPPDPFISIIMRPLLSLKTAGIEYKETQGTTVAGFMPSPELLGNSTPLAAPGYGFAFGAQPGDVLFRKNNPAIADEWLNRAAQKGWISSDTFLNQQFIQTKLQRLDLRASFEPLPDFKVDLSLFREVSDNYSEYFKVVTEGGDFEHLTPMEVGSYTISYVPVATFFKPISSAGYTQAYYTFLKNRTIISNRLGQGNPNSQGSWMDPTDSTTNTNYKAGYGPKQQDVLIASFLAAYFKKNPNTINLNPFNTMPLPNWRVAYNGLTKIKWMKKIFTAFTLTHGYSSTMTVSSFATNLDAGTDSKGNLNKIDSLSNNYFSGYNMPSIVVNEQFSPLIGVDMTFKNKISAKFDYKTSRTITMSFSDFQLIETKATTITVGAGYTIKGLKLPIKINGKKVRLDNDLKFKCDVSYRTGVTINYLIDQAEPEITAGSSTLTVSPAIDYMIAKGINLSMFVDYSHTNPYVLSSFPTTNIKGGFKLKMSLVQ